MKKYDKQNQFSEGLAAVNIGFKEEQTDQMYDPREGYHMQIVSEGKWGYINEKDEIVIPLIYDEAGNFFEGKAKVKLEGKEFFIDKNGNKCFGFDYDTVWNFCENAARVRKSDKFGFINSENQEIIPLMYDDANNFNEGLASVKLNSKWGYINKKNELVIPLQFELANNFYQNRAIIKNQGKYGCIDNYGKEIIPCIAEELNILQAGLIESIQKEKYIYYNLDGKQITPPYNYSNQFYNKKYCIVGNGEGGNRWNSLQKMTGCKWGIIDTAGEIIIPLSYNSYSEAAEHMKKLIPG